MSILAHLRGMFGLAGQANDTSKLIKAYAKVYRLDPVLIAAIIMQESGGDPDAARCEDGFYDKYLKDKERSELVGPLPPKGLVSLNTEKRHRATSWGLMPILGENLRMMGYDGWWLHKSVDKSINLRYGCKFLRHLFDKAANGGGGDGRLTSEQAEEMITRVLKRWNGSDEYPPKVLERIKNGNYKRILHED